jgi:hypothetical protein
MKALSIFFVIIASASADPAVAVYGVRFAPKAVSPIADGQNGLYLDSVSGTVLVRRPTRTQAPFGNNTVLALSGRSTHTPLLAQGLVFDALVSCESRPGRVAVYKRASDGKLVVKQFTGIEIELGSTASLGRSTSAGDARHVGCLEFIPLARSPYYLGQGGLWVDVKSLALKARTAAGTDVVVSCSSDSRCMSGSCPAPISYATCGFPVCTYASTFSGCTNPDTDGDGYADAWETQQGIDLNCDGVLTSNELVLPGANPIVKDIYIAYDWMAKDTTAFPGEAQHQPLPDTFPVFLFTLPRGTIAGPIPRVIAAFAAHNITLHISPNTNASGVVTSPLAHYTVLSFANPPGAAAHPIDCPNASCGNFAACVGPSAISFYQIKNANFDPNKVLTHRYMIFAHNAHCYDATCGTEPCDNAAAALGMCSSASAGYTGLTRAAGTSLFGTDFIVSLGGLGLGDGTGDGQPQATKEKDRLDAYQAGLFMHELGHTLELNHGGAVPPVLTCVSDQNNTNYKPNYVSVMNYTFQSGIYYAATPGSTTLIPPSPNYSQFNSGAWRVDYSYAAFPTLDENSLDDSLGIQAGTNVVSIAYNGAASLPAQIPGTGEVDWGRSGTIESGVVADVNGDGFFTTLTGFDDWGNLQLPFQCRPPAP